MKSKPRFVEPNLTAKIEASSWFRALATKMGISAAALAIAWPLRKAPHILPIPGSRSVDHLREHCDGAAKPLSSDEMGRIEAILPIGWAHGDRYADEQWVGPESYCKAKIAEVRHWQGFSN